MNNTHTRRAELFQDVEIEYIYNLFHWEEEAEVERLIMYGDPHE